MKRIVAWGIIALGWLLALILIVYSFVFVLWVTGIIR